jgi:hypothetical protein
MEESMVQGPERHAIGSPAWQRFKRSKGVKLNGIPEKVQEKV